MRKKQQPDNAPDNAVVVEFMHLVRPIALGMLHCLPKSVCLEDLVSAANMRLVEMSGSLDRSMHPEQQTQFVKRHIRGAILDFLQYLDPMSKVSRKRLKDIESAETAVLSRGAEPNDTEVAKELGVSEKAIAKWKTKLVQLVGTDLDVRGRYFTDTRAMASEFSALFEKVLNALPARTAGMILAHFRDELTYAQIGIKYSVSQGRVAHLIQGGIEKIRDRMVQVWPMGRDGIGLSEGFIQHVFERAV